VVVEVLMVVVVVATVVVGEFCERKRGEKM
jgi:hypothetical protein